jgi:DNA-binding NarL/FixJ family response regulator
LRALTIFDELGAAPLSRTTRRRLRVLGVRAPRGPVEGTRANPAGLTDRQLEVLRLVCDGLTNAEIADRLVVSVRTVDSHVAAVLAKLGVRSRLHALRCARELGVDPTAGDRSR